MPLPDYWLSRPRLTLTRKAHQAFETFYAQQVRRARGAWLERPPLPKWAFLCWLCDAKGHLLHGSGTPDITRFEPRQPNDDSPDEFSKQKAVFASSDGIWPIFYGVIDRTEYRLRMLVGVLQFGIDEKRLSGMRYYFSVTESVLKQNPWREGVVYILPKEGFERQPPYEFAGRRVLEPHWANAHPVAPLAKLRVTPADFPFLEQVRGHDDDEVMAKAAKDPYGFPWLESSPA